MDLKFKESTQWYNFFYLATAIAKAVYHKNVTKSVITASAYYFSSKHQHNQAMNDIKMVTYSVLKYPESCKLILSQHIFSGVGTVSAQIRHHC